MKKLLSVFLVSIIILTNLTFITMAKEEITVIINGEKLVSDVPAQSIEVYDENGNYVGDRTMLPIRAISEKLNCDVFWNEETQGITIYRNNNLYIMWLETEMAFYLEGIGIEKGYKMDVPPTTVNGRTLVPVRAVAELLGAEVNWIGETNTVQIKYELGQIEDNKDVAETCDIYQILLKQEYDTYVSLVNDTLGSVTGKIVLENGKEMNFKLYPEIAPKTCGKFVVMAKEGFYNGKVFHRVIKDFVAQTGALGTDGQWESSTNIEGEFVMNGFFNLIPHKRGTLSLARADDNNSGTQQFFICQKESKTLDGNYAAFGKLIDGYDVLDEICSVQTDENDKPLSDIVIKQVIINE